MPIGAGFAAAGFAPAGYGTPDAAHTPINAVLPEQRTGFPQTGRLIDPSTKDYVITSDGRFQGQDTVPQLVSLALTTIRGSSAQATLGQTYSQIQEKGADFQQQLAARVQAALADLIRAKLIAIDSLVVSESPNAVDAALTVVKWRDLTSGIVTTTAIGP
jgi:hypothetical protein